MKLTMPAVEPGNRDIRVDGVKVGFAIDVWDSQDPYNGAWEARLYSSVTVPREFVATVNRLRLRDLRAELQRRLDTDGPWWS